MGALTVILAHLWLEAYVSTDIYAIFEVLFSCFSATSFVVFFFSEDCCRFLDYIGIAMGILSNMAEAAKNNPFSLPLPVKKVNCAAATTIGGAKLDDGEALFFFFEICPVCVRLALLHFTGPFRF